MFDVDKDNTQTQYKGLKKESIDKNIRIFKL